MNTFQKCVKYFALFLAFSIILSIFSAIASVFFLVGNIFTDSKVENMHEVFTTEQVIQNLHISLKATSFSLVEGEPFSVRSNMNSLECRVENETLVISADDSLWNRDRQVVLSIPKGYQFKSADFEMGAGKVEINDLTTENFDFEMGAGKTDIHDLTVTKNAKIEGGAGAIDFRRVNIHNLHFDMGVGSTRLDGVITGNSKIVGNVGKVDLQLEGNERDYTFDIEKGLSSVSFNHETISSDRVIGNGEHYMKVESGVGSISITTKEKGEF